MYILHSLMHNLTCEIFFDFNKVNYCTSVFTLFARIEFIMTILNSTQLNSSLLTKDSRMVTRNTAHKNKSNHQSE